ncbi:MAG: type I restriction endonuclease, partial [Pseudomonadota bacterium]
MTVGKDVEAALEAATVELFKSLAWETIDAENEVDGDTTLLGREHQGIVVLTRYLEPALKKLNPSLPAEALRQAIESLTRDRSAMSIVNANREVYGLLKNGVKVTYQDSTGSEVIERVRVIDWEFPGSNHFLLVSQLWVNGDPYKRRPDLVGFVNGLPLLLIELKASDKQVYHAFKDNLKDYKTTIAPLLWYNAFIILSNGGQSKIGSLSAPWEHFVDWKKINSEGEAGVISLDTMIQGTCEKGRFIDIFENFCCFSEAAGGFIKIFAKNHQYLGVNNVIAAVQRLTTLTPALSQREREKNLTPDISQGEKGPSHYRGGFCFSGLVERARELREQQTPAEQIMWELLRDRQFSDLKFRRQHQIGSYIADFYCHELKLVVELDGPVHDRPDVGNKDQKRDEYLKSSGFDVLRVTNDEVLEKPETVLEKILVFIKPQPPSPSGRRTDND